MRRSRYHTLLLAGICAAALCAAPEVRAQTAPCDAAATAMEQKYEIPAGLLRAIGQIESGRRDPATGRVSAWPWTINAEGSGRLFDSPADAIAATRALRDRGVASVDVGCFQVNLLHHPSAFASLDEGFDPDRNADYAARFLKALRTRGGTWEDAIAAYHSATPERGLPYRDKVLAVWGQPNQAGGAPPPAAVPLPVVRSVNWSAGSGAMRIWSPSTPGQGASVIAMPQPRLPRG